MFRTSPTLVATLATLAALVVLLGLGTWQVQRLDWKEALIAEREARLKAPPVALRAGDTANAAGLAYRRVRLRGAFLHDKELFFGLRAVGGVPGLEVLTPLRQADGLTVLVNRGWIPAAVKEARRRPETQPADTVEVTGILRPGNATASVFIPGNDPAVNRWFSYDTDTMAAYLGLELAPFVVEASRVAGSTALPVGREATVDLANNHLQYALTWYALAVVLVVIFVLYHRRPPTPPEA